MGTSSFFEYPVPNEEQPPDELLFMSGHSEEHWRAIFAHARPQRFRAGDIVIRLGDVERAIYIVVAGVLEVALVEGGPSGARVIPIPAGSVIGEIGFFDARPRSATVRAITDAEVRRLDHEGYEALAASDPMLARTLLFELGRILAVRLRQTNEFVRGWLG
jgi:CRP-like cAMP-binding protein